MDEAFSADLPAMSNTNAFDPANNSAEHPKILHHAKDVSSKTFLFRMLHVPTFTSEFSVTPITVARNIGQRFAIVKKSFKKK